MSKKRSRMLLAGAVLTAVLIAVLNHSFAAAAKDKAKNEKPNNKVESKADKGESATVLPEESKDDKDISLPVVYAPNAYWIGVRVVPVPEILLPHFGVKDEGSSLAVVENVVEKSPAGKAGLKRGDVILSFGDKDIRTLDDLVAKVAEVKDKTQKMVIFREGKKTELMLTPEERPKEVLAGQAGEGIQFGNRTFKRPALDGIPDMRFGPEVWLGKRNPREMMKEMEEYFRQMQGGNDADQFTLVPDDENGGTVAGSFEGKGKHLQVTTQTDKDGNQKVRVKQIIRDENGTQEKFWEAKSFDELPEEIKGEVKGLLGK